MRLNSETNVLVISGDTAVKSMSQQVLKQAGYILYHSENYQDSCEILESEMVELCVIDYNLWESHQSLFSRAIDRMDTTPVVIMVPLANIGAAFKELNQGIDHLILKPFSGEELLDVVDQTLRMRRDRRLALQVERMAAVNRLTASIAHEINNPLQSIQNCVHMIQYGKLSDQALRDYITMVMEEVERLSKAVKRMLDFHRPGDLVLHNEDINNLVSWALTECESRVPNRDIQVGTDFTVDSPQVIVVGQQVEQAILNILLNSFEAMPGGGSLMIKTRLLENQVIIDIVDSGPGIPADVGQKVFEPFTSTKENRVGLSLAISHGIITAHGGSLELIQKKGKGARFRISLPVEKME